MSERIAVIGAGVMGRNHARTLAEFENVDLTYVVDADEQRAESLVNDFGSEGAKISTEINKEVLDNIDAAVIVSPSQFHEGQATQLMEAGKHVLVEKPVAESAEAAARMGKLANKMGVVAIAGHIELFNPTIRSLITLLSDEDIKEMSFERLSTVPDKSRLYHDVVSDLMIHDIAIALRILEKKGLTTEGTIEAAVGRKDTIAAPDPARATIRFGDIDTHFRASRAYPAGKLRQSTIETGNKILTADLLSRTIKTVSTNSVDFMPDGVFTEDTSNTSYFPRESKQPLTIEQEYFLRCIRGKAGVEDEGVSLGQAARVLSYTEEILRNIR